VEVGLEGEKKGNRHIDAKTSKLNQGTEQAEQQWKTDAASQATSRRL
jgi:hypothetical protein